MSGAIRTMVPSTAMSTRSRACGRTVAAVNAYVWSAGSTAIAASTIAPAPVFTDIKLHARRPKEASQ